MTDDIKDEVLRMLVAHIERFINWKLRVPLNGPTDNIAYHAHVHENCDVEVSYKANHNGQWYGWRMTIPDFLGNYQPKLS